MLIIIMNRNILDDDPLENILEEGLKKNNLK
jgi:hypothetical protein